MDDDNNPNPGIVCITCGCRHMLAVRTRRTGNQMVRTRECRNCGRQIRTRERVDESK